MWHQERNIEMNFGELEEGSYHQESQVSVREKPLWVVWKKKIRIIEERMRTDKLEN